MKKIKSIIFFRSLTLTVLLTTCNKDKSYCFDRQISKAGNFILLQWLVVDGFQRCNLKLLFRQTRLKSSDSAPLQAIQFRYQQ